MAATINLSNFTFSEEQIRDINELVFDEILHAPDLNAIHTLFSGIMYDREIGFIGSSGLVGKAAQGCDPETQDWNINTRKVKWTPKGWEIYLSECASDLADTAAVYCLNKGTRVDDLTDTDYMAIYVQVLKDAVKDALYRIVWFGDTEAKNVASGGSVTDGVDTGYFTIIDGFWKQLEAAAAADSSLLVSIDANTKGTKDEQLSALDGDAAYAILNDLYFKQPIEQKLAKKAQFLVTQTIADGYTKYLMGKGIESTYSNTVDGVPSLKFLGVPVIPVPIWDAQIQAFNDLGDTYYAPHRAVLIEKANLAVGTPSAEAYGEFDIWYNKNDRKNYVLLKDAIDAKLLNSSRLVFAE